MISNFEFNKTIRLTEQDYIDFNNNYHRKKYKIKPIIVWCTILLLSVAIGVFGYNNPNLTHNTIQYCILMFFVSFVFFSIIIWFLYYLFRFIGPKLDCIIYKRIYKKNELIGKETHFTLNELGLESRADTICTFVTWSQIHKIEETDKAFYFFYIKNSAFVLSKRYLDSLHELSELKELIIKFSRLQICYISDSGK